MILTILILSVFVLAGVLFWRWSKRELDKLLEDQTNWRHYE
jgi:hypothetical protein